MSLFARQARQSAQPTIALYGIARGNRRAYLHLEQFQAMTDLSRQLPTAATLGRELKASRCLNLTHWPLEPEPAYVGLLEQMLQQDGALVISLQGGRAQTWLQALCEYGVSPRRLTLALALALALATPAELSGALQITLLP